MAPDVEELIKRVNTLTLDKNRLKQKLAQITTGQTGSRGDAANILINQLSSMQQQQQQQDGGNLIEQSTDLTGANNNNNGNHVKKSPSSIAGNNIIAGVECATSCEDDMLYINDLYRTRLEEYDQNWNYIQSKCTALLSELNALQKHYAISKREKLELEEKLKSKCDECDKIKGELQTVVLNYETQLGAMSEHLSMITSQANLGEKLTSRVQPH